MQSEESNLTLVQVHCKATPWYCMQAWRPNYRKQCYFSSRNHFYSSFYSVHDVINSVLVRFLFFDNDRFSSISILQIILVLVFVLMPKIVLVLVLVQTLKSWNLSRNNFLHVFFLFHPQLNNGFYLGSFHIQNSLKLNFPAFVQTKIELDSL